MNADTVADKLCEASIGPTQGQLDDIMRIIEEVMDAYVDIDAFEKAANERMAAEGYPIRFDRKDELLNTNHAPGRVGEDGMVLMPPQIFGLEVLRTVISHEGVHVFQMAAAARKGKAAEMFKSAHDRMVLPGGRYSREAYYTDKHEVMAHARTLIDRFRAARLNRRQALQQLRDDPNAGKVHREQRNRFLKNAYNYAQDLPEALEDRLPYLNAPDWIIKEAASLDPTGYKYVPWIVKQLQKEAHIAEQTAIGHHTRKILYAFDRLKKLRSFKGEKDINRYKSIFELYNAVMLNSDIKSKKQAQADKAKEGEQVINEITTQEGVNLRLVKFNNADAAMTFSHMTHLCTVGRGNAENYISSGLYGVYKDTKPYVIIWGGDWRTVDDIPITMETWKDIKTLVRVHLGSPKLPHDVSPGPRPYWESADPDNADQIIKRLKVNTRCPHCRKDSLELLTSEQARLSGLRSDIEIWQCDFCGRLANRPPVVSEAADPDDVDPLKYALGSIDPLFAALAGLGFEYDADDRMSLHLPYQRLIQVYAKNQWSHKYIAELWFNGNWRTRTDKVERKNPASILQHVEQWIATYQGIAEAADPDAFDPQHYIDSTPLHRIGRPKLDEFTRSYAACALWSTNDNSDPETGGEPMDRNYDIDDIEDETLWDMVDDCANFRQQHAGLLEQSGLSDDRAGFCFWLSRCGHGSGFFDEGTEVDYELQAAAEAFGNVDLEVSDEGTIYAL